MIVKGDINKLKKLDKGMYVDAATKGVPFNVWMEDHITTNEGGGFDATPYQGKTTFETWKLRRELISKGKDVPPTAMEIALYAHGIKAHGSFTDPVSKFFVNSDTVVLFPWFVQDKIYVGALQASLVPELIAETVVIQGLDFRKIYLDDSEQDRQTARTTRGSEAPLKHFKVKKEQVSLEKYMIELDFDYEAIYDTPLNLYATALRQIGAQLGIDETDDLIYALINGDGNSNGLQSGNTETTVTTTAIEKLDIIKLASSLNLPYKLKKFVGKKAYMQKFWDALSDMQNPAAQWGQTGMQLPVGYEWDRSVVTSDRFYGVDPDFAVSYVTNDTTVMTETDKVINKQQVRTVISKRSKFSIVDKNAIGCLDIEH